MAPESAAVLRPYFRGPLPGPPPEGSNHRAAKGITYFGAKAVP